MAASADSRRAAIQDLDRWARRVGLAAGFMMFVTLTLVWEGKVGAVSSGMLAVLFYGVVVQLHCDMRSLQVLDLIEKQQGKPSV